MKSPGSSSKLFQETKIRQETRMGRHPLKKPGSAPYLCCLARIPQGQSQGVLSLDGPASEPHPPCRPLSKGRAPLLQLQLCKDHVFPEAAAAVCHLLEGKHYSKCPLHQRHAAWRWPGDGAGVLPEGAGPAAGIQGCSWNGLRLPS